MGRRAPRSPATRNASPRAPRPRKAASPVPAKPEGPARALERLYARRLRACTSLGIPVPPEAREGPSSTLLRRIAMLDRRIEVSLDLAGGRRFDPWDGDADEEDPEDDPIRGFSS